MLSPSKLFRPRLECLEARDCPATFHWTGAMNSNWFMPVNWDVYGQSVAPFPTDADDVYLFGDLSNADCLFSINMSGEPVVAKSITVSAGYSGKLTLENTSATGLLRVGDDVWLRGAATSELRLGQSNTLIIGDQLLWDRGHIDKDISDSASVQAARMTLETSADRTTGASIIVGSSGGDSYIQMVTGTAQGLLKLDKGATLTNRDWLEHSSGTIDNATHANAESSLVKNAEGTTWVHQTNNSVTVSVGFLNEGALRIEWGTYNIDDVSTTAQPTYGLKQIGDDSVLSIYAGATLHVTDGANAGKVLIAGGEITTVTVIAAATPTLLTNNGTTKGEVTFQDTKIRLGGTDAGALDLGINDAVLKGTTDFQLTAPKLSGGDSLATGGNISLVGNATKLTVDLTGNNPPAQVTYNVLRCTTKAGDFGTKTRSSTKMDLGGWELDPEDLKFYYRIYFNP